MRSITLLIVHCSATPEGVRYPVEACRCDHILHRRFLDIGYHFYIERDGKVCRGRAIARVGAHCRHHNAHSIGICYEGGLDASGRAADTRTPAQRTALADLLKRLKRQFPAALIVGHHDLDPAKPCPCFDVVREYLFISLT